jgi:hypothetical protein
MYRAECPRRGYNWRDQGHCTQFSDFIFEPVLKDLSFVEETSQV